MQITSHEGRQIVADRGDDLQWPKKQEDRHYGPPTRPAKTARPRLVFMALPLAKNLREVVIRRQQLIRESVSLKAHKVGKSDRRESY